MRGRRWIALVALVGVFLHAGLVVRHNAMVLSAKLEHSALVGALGMICHGNGSLAALPASEQPAMPEPEQDRGSCPMCAGLAPAVAVLSENPLAIHVPDAAFSRMAVVGEIIRLRLADVRPPTRGPPAVI